MDVDKPSESFGGKHNTARSVLVTWEGMAGGREKPTWVL